MKTIEISMIEEVNLKLALKARKEKIYDLIEITKNHEELKNSFVEELASLDNIENKLNSKKSFI